MKEFLPILIGIIWLGFKMYNKNQENLRKQLKKNETIEADEVTSEPQQNFEEILSQFFEPTVQKKSPFADFQESAFNTVEDDYSKVEEIIPQSEPIDYYNPKTDNSLHSVEDEYVLGNHARNEEKKLKYLALHANDDKNIAEDFDFEKAIIYSAILNRPYA
ncbi:MAG: hypothetical protein AUJ98_11835 [Bacteroidetes bacterium CG2_30_33_31]|nr:MAG: hypothetical protein AUJ98_11835 [Bacteroidetes bacterium CG2_30_33_31]